MAIRSQLSSFRSGFQFNQGCRNHPKMRHCYKIATISTIPQISSSMECLPDTLPRRVGRVCRRCVGRVSRILALILHTFDSTRGIPPPHPIQIALCSFTKRVSIIPAFDVFFLFLSCHPFPKNFSSGLSTEIIAPDRISSMLDISHPLQVCEV